MKFQNWRSTKPKSDLKWMLLKMSTGNGKRETGNGEPGTGVWERVYSGNLSEDSKWRTKEKKKANNLEKCEEVLRL